MEYLIIISQGDKTLLPVVHQYYFHWFHFFSHSTVSVSGPCGRGRGGGSVGRGRGVLNKNKKLKGKNWGRGRGGEPGETGGGTKAVRLFKWHLIAFHFQQLCLNIIFMTLQEVQGQQCFQKKRPIMSQEFINQHTVEHNGRNVCKYFIEGRCIKVSLCSLHILYGMYMA